MITLAGTIPPSDCKFQVGAILDFEPDEQSVALICNS